jgi:hypothetical protein
MTNAAKAKGAWAERDAAHYFELQGFTWARRLYGAGQQKDVGDITDGNPRFVYEVKNQKTYKLAEWLKETEQERINGKADYGLLIVKRAGLNISQSMVIQTLEQWVNLRKELG